MLTRTKRQVAIVAATFFMLYLNLFVGSGSFTEAGSEDQMYYAYPTAFTPAPFTFAVWLPIFVGTIVLAVYQALPRNRASDVLDAIALPYMVALIANSAQVFTPIGLSNVAVFVLFASLSIVLARLVRAETSDRDFAWCARIPVAIFATWAGLATILNFCQLWVAYGGTVSVGAAATLIALVMAIGAFFIWRTQQFAVLAVMIWAGFGIYWANADSTVIALAVALTTTASAAVAFAVIRRSSIPA